MFRSTLLLALAALSGCAYSPTPHYDARFGAAVREARALQIINPTPNANAHLGLDGKAAREANTRYVDSFKAPPPTVNVINIGGGPGGGR